MHNRKLPKPGTVPPLLVTLTFQADGRFTGSLDWTLPDAEKDLSLRRPGSIVSNRLTGTLSGKADWTTGKIDWKLDQGNHILLVHEPTTDGKAIEKTTWTTDFSYEFSGWQFQHPNFGTELARSLAYLTKNSVRHRLTYSKPQSSRSTRSMRPANGSSRIAASAASRRTVRPRADMTRCQGRAATPN